MDYKHLTSPCGQDCFNCPFYLASNNPRLKQFVAKRMGLDPEIVECNGCRNIEGKCKLRFFQGADSWSQPIRIDTASN